MMKKREYMLWVVSFYVLTAAVLYASRELFVRRFWNRVNK